MIDVVVALTRRPATAILSRSILVPFPENTPLRIKLLLSSSLLSLSLCYILSTAHNDLLTRLWCGWRIDRWIESVSTALHAAYKANLHLRHSPSPIRVLRRIVRSLCASYGWLRCLSAKEGRCVPLARCIIHGSMGVYGGWLIAATERRGFE